MQANVILAQCPALCEVTGTALVASSLPEEQHDRAGQCVAYLYATHWMDTQPIVYGESDAAQVERLRTGAVKELQLVGLLPTGFGWWLGWWAFKTFLWHILSEWLNSAIEQHR